ncbi:MAG: polymer-forming cytoskeletal protein [Nitrospirota bacterium]
MWKKREDTEIVTYLGKSTEFKGHLSFEGTIRIDGHLEGDIGSRGTLIVGEGAYITGEIKVGTLINQGEIVGNVIAENKIKLLPSGQLKGDIKTPLLIIEEGAVFDGRSEIIKKVEDEKIIRLERKEKEG